MPELPEVETIKRQLNKKVKGKKIKSVEVRLNKFVKCPLNKFKKLVEGAKISQVERRAKLLIIKLSNSCCLIIHLKMSGQLIYQGQPSKHTHLIYYFSDGSQLVHNDLRKFGFVKVVPEKELSGFLKKEEYGPEPLSEEFTLNLFKKMLAERGKSKIKPLLMDQRWLAGIGNLYSDEILFLAKVLPTRTAGSLEPAEIERIYRGIKRILPLAISRRGSSADQYVDTAGQKGNYLPLVKVYGRQGKPCYICGTEIKRMKIGGRSAHFCPKCQK